MDFAAAQAGDPMLPIVIAVLVAMTVVMAVGWTFQRFQENGGWTDVFWTIGTGLTCAVAALVPVANLAPTARQLFVGAMVAVWSLRLGGYVALRVARSQEDIRYANLREEWGAAFQRNMFGLLIVQAPVTAAISFSVLMAARREGPFPGLQDLAGALVFLLAVAGETLADAQMKAFKADPANRGKVCDTGLWAWSRHPNYFFEALIWVAYPVIAIDPARAWSWASLIAPLVMGLIVRFATGVPPLEAAMLRSKGGAYRDYQARVGALLPWRKA
jgi:steroid 5-alpha reductase family enzyme